MNFQVIGLDNDGRVICQTADGETYNSGMLLEEFGEADLTEEEKRAVGIVEKSLSRVSTK